MTENQTASFILLVLLGLWMAVILREARRMDGGWFVYLLYFGVRLYSGIGYRLRTNVRCPFPPDQAAIVVANHRSPLDPMFLHYNVHVNQHPANLFRIIRFLMVDTYYDIHPFVSAVCRSMKVIPVARSGKDMAPIKQAVRALKDGDLIGIFPEAGINLGGNILPADTGVGWLALAAKCPVYPVYIHNAPVGHTMVAPFFNFQQVEITYGEPMTFEEYYGQKKSYEVTSEVTLKIMHEVGRLGGQDMTGYRCLLPGEERHTS